MEKENSTQITEDKIKENEFYGKRIVRKGGEIFAEFPSQQEIKESNRKSEQRKEKITLILNQLNQVILILDKAKKDNCSGSKNINIGIYLAQLQKISSNRATHSKIRSLILVLNNSISSNKLGVEVSEIFDNLSKAGFVLETLKRFLISDAWPSNQQITASDQSFGALATEATSILCILG